MADCVNSSPSLVFWKFRGIGRIWAKIQGNSVEFSGVLCPEGRARHLNSGISKPRFYQTYVLQFGAFHENDGNHENDENDEDNSDSHKQGG